MTSKRSWRARKIDSVTTSLAEAAEKMGFLVHRTNGAWDLTACLVQNGTVELWECKTGKGRVTERQAKLRKAGWPIRTVRTVDDLLLARECMRS